MEETHTEAFIQGAPANNVPNFGSILKCSPEIDKIGQALIAFQGGISNAKKSSNNPHFNSNYASLGEIFNTCREDLKKNGLAIIQAPAMDEMALETGDLMPRVTVTTLLLHSSGQFFHNSLSTIPRGTDPQSIGLCITYLRRYAIAPLIGITQEDDDGNAASKPGQNADRGRKQPAEKLPACPICGKNALIKGKEEYGGGYLCWKKSKYKGCGANFPTRESINDPVAYLSGIFEKCETIASLNESKNQNSGLIKALTEAMQDDLKGRYEKQAERCTGAPTASTAGKSEAKPETKAGAEPEKQQERIKPAEPAEPAQPTFTDSNKIVMGFTEKISEAKTARALMAVMEEYEAMKPQIQPAMQHIVDGAYNGAMKKLEEQKGGKNA